MDGIFNKLLHFFFFFFNLGLLVRGSQSAKSFLGVLLYEFHIYISIIVTVILHSVE